MENLILYHNFFGTKVGTCFFSFEANYFPTKSKPEDHMYTVDVYIYIHIHIHATVYVHLH